VFATKVAGVGLLRVDDDVNELERENRQWATLWQQHFRLPLFVFGGRTGLAYYLATVPELADARGYQPVVHIEAYDEPQALPVASSVDRFFESWSRYLEALVAHPDHAMEGAAALSFPWKVPEILAMDRPLVELIRAGRFDPLLTEEAKGWVARVVRVAG
jgi:hypothetical protein